jgi:hypothetical protein
MPPSSVDLSAVTAGLIAYALSVLASTLLVFLLYRVNLVLTSRQDAERMLLSGHRSVAIALGSVVLSQAVLLRHAVFPAMAVVRDLFVQPLSWRATLVVAGRCALFFAALSVISVASVLVAGWLFAHMTGALPEREEILRDNVAMAIFFGFVLLAITLIVNEGVQDLARSLIPYGRGGIVRVE